MASATNSLKADQGQRVKLGTTVGPYTAAHVMALAERYEVTPAEILRYALQAYLPTQPKGRRGLPQRPAVEPEV